MDTDDAVRTPMEEVRLILRGETRLLPTREHLLAQERMYEATIARLREERHRMIAALDKMKSAKDQRLPCLPDDPNEPIFILRAQDISAAFVVELWCAVNVRLQMLVSVYRMQPESAMLLLISELSAVPELLLRYSESMYTPKTRAAMMIADSMNKWPTKKLAD